MFFAGEYDILVIGAGHAGIEAALAAARMGANTLLATLSLDNLALMPCNPSVGGPAKGHLVREIDALGGEMGLCADACCIQFRMLNTGKGPAVHALRAQADKRAYQERMKAICEAQERLHLKQLMVERLLIEEGEARGAIMETGEIYRARKVILATGTYLKGRIILGEVTYSAGPNGQRAAMKLSDHLRELGLSVQRFKTGTPARLDARSLDYTKMQIQEGDDPPPAFSFLTDEIDCVQIPCHLSYTNERTHEVIRRNFHRAPMANGVIEGIGPRYCPSIETKIERFPEKEQHQLFLEPEGRNTREIYVQGMSTSLPPDVQIDFIRTIPGLEHAELMRAGYAIEYDCLDPLELKPSLEVRSVPSLYSAGQMNGTSGYEEAAAQGLIAGINAARSLQGKEPLILKRSEAYIGVLIDDLVTKGTSEPYRMMTSRAEFRLILRQDNADLRLTPIGRAIGLVDDERWARFEKKKKAIEDATRTLRRVVTPSRELTETLKREGIGDLRSPLPIEEFLRRSDVTYEMLRRVFSLPDLSREEEEQVEILFRYEGYIEKQAQQVERMRRLEEKRIPEGIDYRLIHNLRDEAKEKLSRLRPYSLGQASRISGVSPADVSVLHIAIERERRRRSPETEIPTL